MSRAASIYALNRKNWRMVCGLVALWELFFLGYSIVAAVDVMGRLGWGRTWRDVRDGLGMAAAGLGAFGFIWLTHRIVRGIITMVYGPDPAAQNSD